MVSQTFYLDRARGVKPSSKSKKEENKVPGKLIIASLNPIFMTFIGTFGGSSNSSGFQGNVGTLGQMNYNNSSRPGEQKVGRIDNSETTIDKLQKIAMNSDKLDTMPCMQKVKDRRFVEEVRDPAKFNMMTFDREYGGIPE